MIEPVFLKWRTQWPNSWTILTRLWHVFHLRNEFRVLISLGILASGIKYWEGVVGRWGGAEQCFPGAWEPWEWADPPGRRWWEHVGMVIVQTRSTITFFYSLRYGRGLFQCLTNVKPIRVLGAPRANFRPHAVAVNYIAMAQATAFAVFYSREQNAKHGAASVSKACLSVLYHRG